jgi:aldehyde:ferredoxin oxidoreductase
MRGRKIPREMFERHLQEYFAHRGWDREGRPTVETLERLGLVQYL